jgi:cell division protein FtsB
VIVRARIILAVAFVLGLVIVSSEFPLGQLMSGRAALGQDRLQLRQLDAENRQLSQQLSSLRQPGTIVGIAHAEYGLVTKGEQSIVVLPSPHDRSADPLRSTTVPSSDLVPTDAIVSPGGVPAGGRGAGFWSRLLQRLEFWRAVP